MLVTHTNYCEVFFYERDGSRARNDAGQEVPALGGCNTYDGHAIGWLDYVAVSPDAGAVYFGDSAQIFTAPLRSGLQAPETRWNAVALAPSTTTAQSPPA